jgi:hypothetical protein
MDRRVKPGDDTDDVVMLSVRAKFPAILKIRPLKSFRIKNLSPPPPTTLIFSAPRSIEGVVLSDVR